MGVVKPSGRQVSLIKPEHLLPAVERLGGAVAFAPGVEEGMADTVIAVELVSLAMPLERLFDLVDLRHVRVLVLVAENAEQRSGDLVGQIDRRHRTLGIELLVVLHDDAAAPAIHNGIDAAHAAGGPIRKPSAGAVAD